MASVCQVSIPYIDKALGRRRTAGETSARPWAGGPKPKLAAHDEAVRKRAGDHHELGRVGFAAEKGPGA
ncbi:MAG: hypothetical protein ACREC0_13640 [Methylocella sp.]